MNIFDKFLNWSADRVQTFTGEKERRQKVEELKREYGKFVCEVEKMIPKLNGVIQKFNNKINNLNALRSEVVHGNITILTQFLRKFGHVKDIGNYVSEHEKEIEALPSREFEVMGNYIEKVDWSREEVFLNTFFLSPLGMKSKVRKQNLSMNKELEDFKLNAKHVINNLKSRTLSTELDSKICTMYTDCVKYASQYIEEVIIPELELVESFFQAIEIKNYVIVEQSLQSLVFRNNISTLRDTPYHKHYLFVKNTFIFYVLSCKIYNTPVLTRLLQNKTSNEDLKIMENQNEALLLQGKELQNYLIMPRGMSA